MSLEDVVQLMLYMTDLSASVGNTDVAARVTLLGELASEEVVQLGTEDTVSDELALLADLARHLEDERAGKGRDVGKSMGLGPASSGRCNVHPSRPTAISELNPGLGPAVWLAH